jgi:hypothetical protein
MATESQERNPYVGPRPFERQDRDLFFGRDGEASEVLSLVIAHRMLLLYAQSGAGKTSLINAGLIPLLEEEGFEILPLARVQGLIPKDIQPEAIPNLYAFNVLMSWAEEEADPKRLAQMSFADFLKEREHPTDEKGLPSPRIVIFDQFEELFTFYPERWQDREGFFEQVRDALEGDPLLRVVFAIREDYIAQLDPYAPLLPEKLRARFRMERLRERAALAAIIDPLRDTMRSFAEGVAEQLVEELLKVRVQAAEAEIVEVTGEFVEPVQLQVVCQSLWQDLPPDVTVITQDHLQAFGDVNQTLSGFYERSIKRAAQEPGVREGDLREWFEHGLITPAGTRGTVYRGREETSGIPNAAVDVLENLHLIRGEWRAGARWYELTHDRFIGPIQESNKAWLDKWGEAEQTRRWLEAEAAKWVQGSRGLLDKVELRRLETERWLTSPYAAILGDDQRTLVLHSAIQRGWNIERWIERLGKAPGGTDLLRKLLDDPEEATRLNAIRAWRYMPVDSVGDKALTDIALNDPVRAIRTEAAVSIACRAPQQGVELIMNRRDEASHPRVVEALAHIWDETAPLRQLPISLRLQTILALARIRLKRSGRALLYHSVAGIVGGIVTGLLFGLIVSPLHWMVDEPMWETVGFSLQAVIAAWLIMGPWFAGTLGTVMILSSALPLALLKQPKRWQVLSSSALLAGIIMGLMLGIVYQGNFLRGALWQACFNGFVIGSLMGGSVAELFYHRWDSGSMPSPLIGILLGATTGLISSTITSFFPRRHDIFASWLMGITIGSTLIVGGVNLAVQNADRFIAGLSPEESKGGWFK